MKKLIVFLFIVGLVSVGVYFWWQNGLTPVDPDDTGKKTFVVRNGEGTREIVDDLKSKGLIRDSIVFFLLIKQLGVDEKMQAGVFYLSPSMTTHAILKELQTGKIDIAVTIPEGKRAEEFADIFKQNFTNYTEEWRGRLNAEEGYLFPDTYYLPKDTGIEQVIEIMKKNFDKKYADVSNHTNLSQNEIVILASLIEREAKHAEDRALVSSVIHNRLNAHMKLDIDATVQYALGFDTTEQRWWKKGLTNEDIDIDSLYNTYKTQGLPPGPICNPGLASLIAAANPADTDFVYYLSDKEGNNHYARTLAEHNKNIETYLE